MVRRMNEPNVILEMLGGASRAPRTLAVVGLSDNPMKPSFYVSEYMQRHGFRILPVNPALDSVLGQKCFPTLTDLPIKPDIVNVFRLPKFIPAIVEDMITLGFHNLWVQQGIIHREAAARAEAAGISVVMDRCIMVEHSRLLHQ
jgi:predicted CoA-binding protein